MTVVEDMKRVAQEMATSYQSRICEVAEMIDNIHGILEDCRHKRDMLSDDLRGILAREGFLRKKDFDNMMKSIMSYQDEREKEVKNLLKTFFEEHKEIAETVKKCLSEDAKIKIGDFRNMLQDIQVRQKARESEVSTLLKEFQTEYNETAESLRSLLDRGEDLRIRAFKEMIKNIRIKQLTRAKEVRSKLDKFKKERQDTASEWHKIASIMVQKTGK